MKHTLLVLAVLMSGTLSAQYSIKLTQDYKNIFKPKLQDLLYVSLWMRGWDTSYYFMETPMYSQIQETFPSEDSLFSGKWENIEFNEEMYVFHSNKDRSTFREIRQFVVDNMIEEDASLSRHSGPGYVAYLQYTAKEEVVIVVIFYS